MVEPSAHRGWRKWILVGCGQFGICFLIDFNLNLKSVLLDGLRERKRERECVCVRVYLCHALLISLLNAQGHVIVCGLYDSNTILSKDLHCIASFCYALSISVPLPFFSGEFVTFIRASKVNLVSNMRTVFLFYFTPYEDIFDEFYDYLEKGVMTGDLCDIEQQFTKVRSLCVCVCVGGGGSRNSPSPQ